MDVYIQGGGDSLSLHNGLFGPATTVYHAAYDASRSGDAVGGWNSVGRLEVTLSGRELRKILAQVKRLPPHHRRPEDDEGLHRFCESITDDATYEIRGMEF
ncbi:hypothetical protein ACI79Z_09970 [Geodermatophilus sp. SYSU D00663]